MSGPRHVAVIDIGKTNVKLAMVDLDTLSEISVITRPNTVLSGPPYPHFDIEGHWRFMLDGLKALHAERGIDAISVTTHGACAVWLDGNNALATPVLDYEHDGPDALAAEYDRVRPGFDKTGSPRLPGGLNIGAQLHWLLASQPGLDERLATIVTYPQYWSQRLTGVASTDVTSLGCHTDLWEPHSGRFSSLVDTLGLTGKLAPARHSAELLGPLLPDVARATTLPSDTPVACGIHDSNASLYTHLLVRQRPFSVVSTGTWVIIMSIDGQAVRLDPRRDTLINVNALGKPVNSARFMGGREFELVSQGRHVEPSEADIDSVLESGVMLLPAVEMGSGPFRGRRAKWIGHEPDAGCGRRAAALGLYLGMMTAECLQLTGHMGEIVVEGSFARNRPYLAMLAAASGSPVAASPTATGTSIGAALLHGSRRSPPRTHCLAPVTSFERLQTYYTDWLDHLR